MPNDEPPEQGTMVIAALLVLGLAFAGYWISGYVQGDNSWALAPWFGVAAVVIIALGLFMFWRRGGDSGGR